MMPFKPLLRILLLLTLLPLYELLYAQDPVLKQQLEQSRHLSVPMQEDTARAGMTRWLKKKVQRSKVLPLAADFSDLRIKGPGTMKIDPSRTISGQGSVLLETSTALGVKNPTNRSYAFAEMIRPLNGEDLREYNRFSVWVYADAPGFYSFFVGCTLYNEGEQPMPTPGRFEGQLFCWPICLKTPPRGTSPPGNWSTS